MKAKLYKQTFKAGATVQDVHDEIGGRGGTVVRIDQTEKGTTAYFEAGEGPSPPDVKGAAADIQEVSLEEVTKV